MKYNLQSGNQIIFVSYHQKDKQKFIKPFEGVLIPDFSNIFANIDTTIIENMAQQIAEEEDRIIMSMMVPEDLL